MAKYRKKLIMVGTEIVEATPFCEHGWIIEDENGVCRAISTDILERDYEPVDGGIDRTLDKILEEEDMFTEPLIYKCVQKIKNLLYREMEKKILIAPKQTNKQDENKMDAYKKIKCKGFPFEVIILDKQGEDKMPDDKDTTKDTMHGTHRTKFNWPPIDVKAISSMCESGYVVTTPDSKEHYISASLFDQLFSKVSPEDDKAAKITIPYRTATELSELSNKENMNIIDAGRKSLNERWIPISNAMSIKEMEMIVSDTVCALCILYKPSLISRNCGGCVLHDNSYTCCWEYIMWHKYCGEKDYRRAKLAAQALCRRIKEIVHNAGG